jgi:hypothetical protein
MAERRTRHRRRYKIFTRFPLLARSGETIKYERRMIPTRRLNDIAVREIDCSYDISGLD